MLSARDEVNPHPKEPDQPGIRTRGLSMAELREVVFVMAAKQNRFFFELAEALAYEMRALGVDSWISTTGFPALASGRVYVLLPPHEYFALEGYRTQPGHQLLRRTIFVSAEQPGSTHFYDNIRLADRAGALFDINPSAVRSYDRAGVKAQLLQLGYSPSLDRFPGAPEKRWDVVFMGSYTRRRARILSGCATQLSRLRSRLIMSDNSRPNSSASSSFVAGEDKLSLLGRAAVMVNLHQSDVPYFEWARVLDAIHCGCALVTEHSMDFSPLVPGEHFASARPKNLGDVVEWVARDEATRERLSRAAYDLVRSKLRLALGAEALVAAAVELDRPVGSARSLVVRALSGVSPSGVARHLREQVVLHLKEPPIVPGTPYGQDPDIAELRSTLREIRLDLLELRRAVRRTELLATEGTQPHVVKIRFKSQSWRVGTPKVSVLIALYNHASYVAETLDSLLSSRMTDLEVVITDDGSTDGGSEAVTAWSVAHPEVPLLLLEHPVNRGLGPARNSALDLARGEFCFILDSDNLVYPNTFEDLIQGLRDEPAGGFAYGYVAMYEGDEPFGLLNWYPWEPARLRTGNYIDAMALFRTEVLRRLGGYTTDRRLYGWEDYDMYCRLAELGVIGAFVPQIVARYRVSPTSMLSISNLSYHSAFAALKERYPRLMAGVQLPL